MKSSFQAGHIVEMVNQILDRGWEYPFRMVVGSSSGSPMAVAAATASPIKHDLARNAWLQFGKDLHGLEIARKSLSGDLTRPYREALEGIFNNTELLRWEEAYNSPTTIVIVATHLDVEYATKTWGGRFDALREGLQRLLDGDTFSYERVARELSAFSATGATGLFVPRYYSTKPWPSDAPQPKPDNWDVFKNADELRQIVAASTRIPPFTGMPIRHGEHILIDGAWSDNVPARLPPAFGVQQMYLVNCTHKGKLFDKPISSYPTRRANDLLEMATNGMRYLGQLTQSRLADRISSGLNTLGQYVKKPEPIDLERIQQDYPKLEIYEDHLPKEAPNPYRFWAPPQEDIRDLYGFGISAAQNRGDTIPEPPDLAPAVS